MNKREASKIIAEIKKHEKQVAKDRDELDKFIETLTDLRESCDDAWRCLESARDSLSQFV